MTIADASNSVFTPAISARTCVIVWKIFPGSAAGAVVLPDRSPLTLGKIGSPTLPILLVSSRLLEPPVFDCQQSRHRIDSPLLTSSHRRTCRSYRTAARRFGVLVSHSPGLIFRVRAKIGQNARHGPWQPLPRLGRIFQPPEACIQPGNAPYSLANELSIKFRLTSFTVCRTVCDVQYMVHSI